MGRCPQEARRRSPTAGLGDGDHYPENTTLEALCAARLEPFATAPPPADGEFESLPACMHGLQSPTTVDVDTGGLCDRNCPPGARQEYPVMAP